MLATSFPEKAPGRVLRRRGSVWCGAEARMLATSLPEKGPGRVLRRRSFVWCGGEALMLAASLPGRVLRRRSFVWCGGEGRMLAASLPGRVLRRRSFVWCGEEALMLAASLPGCVLRRRSFVWCGGEALMLAASLPGRVLRRRSFVWCGGEGRMLAASLAGRVLRRRSSVWGGGRARMSAASVPQKAPRRVVRRRGVAVATAMRLPCAGPAGGLVALAGSPGEAEELVPRELRARLLDARDHRGRAAAMAALGRALWEAPAGALSGPGLPALLGLLRGALGDASLAVARGALEALGLVAARLGPEAAGWLEALVGAAAAALGDPKPAVRLRCQQLFVGLMRAAGPQPVLDRLLRPERLQHRQARVREALLALAAAALLAFPRAAFRLPRLARALAPALADPKPRVRRAALEALAALHAALGPARAATLLRAVDALELRREGRGALAALRARLARKALPRLTPHGLLEYALPMPAAPGAPPGADTDWLLQPARARSAHSGTSARDDDDPAGPCPRRVLSAGKGKLPWESDPASLPHTTATPELRFLQQMCLNELNIEGSGSELNFDAGYDAVKSPVMQTGQEVSNNVDNHHISTFFSFLFLLQFSTSNDFFHSPRLRPSQGAMASHQPPLSGKPGLLGLRGKSGSVDSDLQFLGLSTPRHETDSVRASLSFTSKPQRMFCSPPEPAPPLLGSHTTPGAFILPSYPFSSPSHSPKHASSLADPLKKSPGFGVSFSNSWPLKSFEGLPKPAAQKKFSSPTTGGDAETKPQDAPPIQLKPAFVRSPASRKGLNGSKPVPPIPRGVSPLPERAEFRDRGHKNGEPEDIWLDGRDGRLAIDLSELDISEKELEEEEMQSSLRSLRNSAAKKRAKLRGSTSDLESPDSVLKLDWTSESPSCLSSPSTSSYSESGVYSQESVTSPLSAEPQGRRTMSDIFPLGGSSRATKLSPSRHRGPIVVEHSLGAGTAFHEKAASSVSGQCLSYSNGSGDYEDDRPRMATPVASKGQSKEHQRHSKPTKGCAGPSLSLHQLDSLDFTSPSALADDSVVIVGKGMFESPPAACVPCGQSQIFPTENGDAPSLKASVEPLSGIYGRAVPQQNPAPSLDVDTERDVKVALSKSAREKMRQKKKEEKEHQEVGDLERKELSSWELFKQNDSEKMAPEARNTPFTPLLKRTSSVKRTQPAVAGESGPRMPFRDGTLLMARSTEIMGPTELRPFSKPEAALSEALQYLADDDWEKKMEGLNAIRCLSAYHPDTLTAKLHETTLAVVQEVKNLRSVVSRAAVICLGDLFSHLKKSLDQELDGTVKVLLHKAGESNTFIREDVEKALKAMVNNATPARALASLINGGQSHLNTAVRRCAAQHLSDVVEHMGPGRVLSGIKDVTDKVLPAVAKFVQDGSPETRYYGRKMLFSLMTHADFERMLEKYVQPKDLPYVKETLSSLRQKGLGEMPIVTPSAKGRRAHTSTTDSSRSASLSRDTLSAGDREVREVCDVTRKLGPRNTLESAEYVKVLTASLNAKDFRERISGIRQLLEDTESNQDLVVANIVKIFDAFKPRLHDSNSKVNQVALETMRQLIPLLKEKLSPVINMLIPALVDNNLNSKNPGIYAAATGVIQALCQHLDNYLLLQPFCTKAQFLSGKAKQDVTEILAELVVDLYPRKPHAVEQKVPVVLWHLLGSLTNSGSLPGAGGNIRAATAKLSKALFAQMGQNLLAQAASQPPHVKRTLEEFLDQAT
ncbi:TOG array regulator of axonemal microtubules protein 1 [Heteronotia binoei]|uniref:TOG array regulator of axonemal microtubules protein 1 n=1 Tax=Heteronotia binoei TaxID=13085 RepID=UPI00292FBA20|nr:TOG array regulator of axonemal microtubules protein 1 [Heteronotia binoei]